MVGRDIDANNSKRRHIMSMEPLRNNVAIAIDGGGIKGLIVARALTRLERELGERPLIDHPQIKVLAGTSTGSLISMALAIGMSGTQIADMYYEFGQKVFPPLSPVWLPDIIRKADEFLRILFQHSLYKTNTLVKLMREAIGEHTGNPDLTLGELNTRLGPGKSIIFTAVDIARRRTRFIKSYQEKWAHWKLYEAALASSVAPVALPVYKRTEKGSTVYYTDGGVGSFGNPAYVATQEIITFQNLPPNTVSVLSFGTGWVKEENYARDVGEPTKWLGLDWAMNAPLLITGDATRAQSIDIIDRYGAAGLDFRRFQFPLEKDISSDAYASKETYELMNKLGEKLGESLVNNRYAPNEDRQIDPEGIWDALEKFEAAKQ
jgi:patatin-like phospholipase/acyl hydrolase